LFSCIRSNPKRLLCIFYKKDKITFLSCFKNAKWISSSVHDYPLGFDQNIKNPTTISLLFGALGFSCKTLIFRECKITL
jgi:hypothetical protein